MHRGDPGMNAPETSLTFTLRQGGAERTETITIKHAVIAGWTGRDQAALEKHIKELEELGVARPATTPIFYRVASARLSHASVIEATGEDSSGEVEFVLVQHGGKLYVGCGSDHTDRKLETVNVTASKQMCEKPISATLWAYDDVKPHWEKLMLRSFITEGGARVLYQEGSVTAMKTPEELISRFVPSGKLEEGTLMFCGTLAAKGGIRPSGRFEFEIDDPVRGQKIGVGYDIATLPVLG